MPQLESVKQHDRTLELFWNDGSTTELPYLWLRDNASDARHANGQKLIDTLSIPLDITVREVSFNDDELRLIWSHEESSSSIKLEQLWTSQYPEDGQREVFWQASDITRLPGFSFAELHQEDALLAMLESVEKLGFALVTELSTQHESLFKVVNLFGFVRETNYGKLFDVRTVTNPSNLAFTGLTLGGHTDNPYRNPVPTLQLLHCLDNSAEGGESTLVDGFKVAEDLRAKQPDKFKVLANTSVTFRFQSADTDLQNTSSIIQVNREGKLTGICFNNRSMQALDLAANEMLEFYEAYYQFGTMLEDETYRIVFKLEPGELMLFDNTRVLHGRVGYTGSGSRHLQGCYADKDGLLSKLAVLKRSKGA